VFALAHVPEAGDSGPTSAFRNFAPESSSYVRCQEKKVMIEQHTPLAAISPRSKPLFV
jgi:hypothetical protein